MKEKIQNALKDRLTAVSSGIYRQKYHLMADIGWISDPNGLCEHQGIYHIFHQYTPAEDLGLHKCWGHYITRDFHRYADLGMLMCPDSEIDKDGCYSGSGFSHNGKLHLFYTGNILHDGDYDYINEGRGHYTNTLLSEDGLHFSKKQVLLKNEDYPENMSCHVRDPKVSRIGDHLYMVIGARTKDSQGCALLYECDPEDLNRLTFRQVICSEVPFGYMWECPVLMELDGRPYLLTCPQGVSTDGYQYENVYQNGLFELTLDENGLYTAVHFQELDHGFDFYAPQSFRDEKGREILIGWMGIPDADYDNPEKEEGWIHCLSLPREIRLKDGRITQFPIREILDLKTDEQKIELKPDETVEIPQKNFHFEAGRINNRPFELQIRQDVRLIYEDGLLTLAFKESGAGRSERHIELAGRTVEQIDLFSDTSSLEIFINRGEYAFATRIYDGNKPAILKSSTRLSGRLSRMQPFEISCEAAIGKLTPEQAQEWLSEDTDRTGDQADAPAPSVIEAVLNDSVRKDISDQEMSAALRAAQISSRANRSIK